MRDNGPLGLLLAMHNDPVHGVALRSCFLLSIIRYCILLVPTTYAFLLPPCYSLELLFQHRPTRCIRLHLAMSPRKAIVICGENKGSPYITQAKYEAEANPSRAASNII